MMTINATFEIDRRSNLDSKKGNPRMSKVTYIFAFSIFTFVWAASSTGPLAEAPNRDYIKEAQPYLHLTCEGLVEAYGKDEKKTESIVELMVAVSLINRSIDITKLIESKEDEAEFGKYLEKALTSQCEADVESLMIANVDNAIVYAFGEKKLAKTDNASEENKD